MSDLQSKFLPKQAEVTAEIYDWPTGNPDIPFFPGWIVGVQLPDGSYDPRWPPRLTLTKEESWALCGVLSKVSGCPVRDLAIAGGAA